MATTDHVRKFNTLTERQKDVLRLFCKGIKYKKIGEELFISEDTIKTHVGNIYQKLELTHLEPKQRAAIIFETYCPLLKESSSALEIIEGEIIEDEKGLEPVSPRVQKMVEEDENALALWESAQIIDIREKKDPAQKGRQGGCVWGFIGIIVGLGLMAGYLFFFGGGIPGIGTPDSPPLPSEEPAGTPPDLPESPLPITDTAVVILATETPISASETPLPSDTPVPPTATTAPSATPAPDTQPGSILEVGEWWKEEGVWLRLASYHITDDIPGISITLELWNKTDGTLLFSWTTSGNLSLRDNNGFNYPLTSQFTNLSDNEKFEPEELKVVRMSNHGITAFYQDDRLFNADVTELILTVVDFSRIDQAQFRITLNK